MKVMVVGLGYVGSVLAAGLAKAGHQVTGVDIDQRKVDSFRGGSAAIQEPGLNEIISEALKQQNIHFFNISEIDKITDSIVFVCVGTPYKQGAGADTSQVFSTIEWIKAHASQPLTIVMKSTVPPRTGNRIIQKYLGADPQKFKYIMNPEFLREGQAINDWFHPDRTVIGGTDDSAVNQVRDLYANIDAPVIITDITTAEMIKYAANAYLATKISFINEIAGLCEQFNANIDMVAKGIGMDKRIGQGFLRAGVGYGGSCFPKDTKALHEICNYNGIDFDLLEAVIKVNNRQRVLAIQKLKEKLGSLDGKKIAVLGLAFKPNTDDIRESPALDIIKALHGEGAEISAYDPLAIENARVQLPENVRYCSSAIEAVKGTDAVLLVTEWQEFIDLNWQSVKTQMESPCVIVDGRNCLDKEKLISLGFNYTGFGRNK